MELLLQEKAKLAEENSRLLRENTGLQVCAPPRPAALDCLPECAGVAHRRACVRVPWGRSCLTLR